MSASAVDIVGLESGDSRVLDFLNGLDPSYDEMREVKKYSDCTYWNYKKIGLSLCLKPHNTKSIIDTVYVYNKGIAQYSKYKGTLPKGLSMDLINVNVVKLLGEPDKKGGITVPVWISYESEKTSIKNAECGVGVQIDFQHKSFGDLENPITVIAFFKL
ncbi:tpm [Acrasis kona]|uniref:Tpm n=1 Tax=Acrasis kona TaxID=1008807 RepID=A0AAW2YLX6_9EUKA